MTGDIVINNFTEINFIVSLYECTNNNLHIIPECEKFLFAQNYRSIKQKLGFFFMKFYYFDERPKDFVLKIKSPGIYDLIHNPNNSNNFILVEKKIFTKKPELNLTSTDFSKSSTPNMNVNQNNFISKYDYDLNNLNDTKKDKETTPKMFSQTKISNFYFNNQVEKILRLNIDYGYETKNYIEIINNSMSKVYIRLSSIDKTDNFLKEVKKNESIKWLRNEGIKFHVQIEKAKKITNGPIYKVNLSESYILDLKNYLRTSIGEEIKLDKNKFGEGLEKKEKTKYNYSEKKRSWIDNLKPKSLRGKIIFNNLSNENIKIRFSDDKYNFLYIKDKSSESIKKKIGKYILEINKEFGNFSQKYHIFTEKSYTFNSDYILVEDDTRKILIQIYDIFSNLVDDLIFKDKDELFTKKNFLDKKPENEKGNKISSSLKYFNDIKPKYHANSLFIDETFPPNYNSLCGLNKDGKTHITTHFPHLPAENFTGNFKFVEPKIIFKGKEFYLFKNQIEPNDVIQGELGDCYLMSIFSAMGQRADLIKNAFRSTEINKDGFYQIYFYDTDGIKKIMFVDHFFPYVEVNGKYLPFGARPNEEEIWVMILEKAYAKYEGGYSNISGGSIKDELFWLTGSFCQELDCNSNLAWNSIKISCKKKHIICCKSKQGSGNHYNRTKKNIANTHAYSILGADEFKGVKLLILRNPWAQIEWKGDYSDNCPLWTDDFKNFFCYDIAKGENGIFFIKFEDFVKEFDELIICYC